MFSFRCDYCNPFLSVQAKGVFNLGCGYYLPRKEIGNEPIKKVRHLNSNN